MQRDLSSRASEPVMRLKGQVEVKMITCVSVGPGDAVRCDGAMVLQADEVDYNEKTGEIDARGNVHIVPHRPLR
jgi:lipopolysaccharide assembly outer membrane protein LptD (OstA)